VPTTLLSAQEPDAGPRQRLLDAMISVVARRGYHQSTVKDVITQAGSSRSTFYAQFADMQDILEAALSVLAAELCELVDRALDNAPPADAPTVAAQALLDFAHEQVAPARVLFCESLAGGGPTMAARDELIDELARLIEARVAQDQSSTIDLPAGAALGGIFRLLSFRLRRGASGLHEVQDGVLAWLDAYGRDDLQGEQPIEEALQRLGALPAIGLQPAAPPAPVRLGREGAGTSDRSRNQRERILFATAQCCFRDGYPQMSVGDIVTAAGVSRTVFYEHFRDKQHVTIDMLEHGFELTISTSARAYFLQEDWSERIWAVARSLCDAYATLPAQLSGCFVEYAAIGPAGVRLVHDRLMPFTLLLQDGFGETPRAEGLPRLVAELVVSLIHELAYREMRRRKPPERFYDLLPLLSYGTLAPFVGPRTAREFVTRKVQELQQTG
jgi:AcrR family transcriptional regulator